MENKMKTKKIVLWGIIAVLAIVVIYLAFFRGSIGSSVIRSAGQAAKDSYSGMVGGC